MGETLRRTHPQKYCLKIICKLLFYLGIGNCWYEDTKLSRRQKIGYYIYAVLANGYGLIGYLDEVFAYLRPKLSLKEKNDLLQFCIGHTTICAKLIVLYIQKGRIKTLLEKFLEKNRELASLKLENQSVKRAMKYCFTLIGTTYVTLFSSVIDGVRTHVSEGIPIRTEVILYPSPSDSGILVNILRFLTEFHWWYVVTIMISIDCLSACSLVFLSSKFELLTSYFEGLRQKYLKHEGSRALKEQEFKKDFVIGIKLHEDTLWCARHVQYALGNVYSIQVIESIALIVFCLIKLVTLERNLTFLVASFTYMSCLVSITGTYMMAGGSISFQAERVSTAMFHSGWDLTGAKQDLRTLIVVALIRSQSPISMTAFGIITLSYANFISVLRLAYSFFAVMY